MKSRIKIIETEKGFRYYPQVKLAWYRFWEYISMDEFRGVTILSDKVIGFTTKDDAVKRIIRYKKEHPEKYKKVTHEYIKEKI